MSLKRKKVIREIELIKEFIKNGISFDHICIQDIDFTQFEMNWDSISMKNTCFLGCHFSKKDQLTLLAKGVMVMPKVYHLPYNPYRSSLYTWQELESPSRKSNDRSVDLSIYENFESTKFNPEITDALWQRIHDHAIDDAMRDMIKAKSNGTYDQKCIGIMGGHGVSRQDPYFKLVAKTSRLLAKAGYLIVTGGGPGIMEAGNLGAYFSSYGESDLDTAIEMLGSAPHFKDAGYLDQALEVLELFPVGVENLAIPTWFYGHEPSNIFASHIAKYFSNSIREDNLLAICIHGIIFAPGSAGTVQEIFMDATQNHYGTFRFISPMVFLGKDHYINKTGIFPLLQRLSEGRKYADGLFISDQPDQIAAFISQHPPYKL